MTRWGVEVCMCCGQAEEMDGQLSPASAGSQGAPEADVEVCLNKAKAEGSGLKMFCNPNG